MNYEVDKTESIFIGLLTIVNLEDRNDQVLEYRIYHKTTQFPNAYGTLRKPCKIVYMF